ncbi:MAG: hypothetical protein ACHQXA_05235, partial [Gemmatimonadales bacterium]
RMTSPRKAVWTTSVAEGRRGAGADVVLTGVISLALRSRRFTQSRPGRAYDLLSFPRLGPSVPAPLRLCA